MKKLLLWLLVLLLLCVIVAAWIVNQRYEVFALHPFWGDEEHDIRVMTWNVHCSTGNSRDSLFDIADVILLENPDVVQLNEYDADCCMVLDSILRAEYAYVEGHGMYSTGGDAIYSKFPLASIDRLSEGVKKEIPMNAVTMKLNEGEMALVGVHLESNSGDGSGLVYNTDSLKVVEKLYARYKSVQEKREESVGAIKRWVLRHNLPTIVMGDMNDFCPSAPLDTLTSIGMKDAWWEGGFGYGCTFHTGLMFLRIDHVFHTTDLELTGIKVIKTRLSDHNPMVAEFKLKKDRE